MNQIWQTIFSKETIGIGIIIIGAFIVMKLLKKMNKMVLAALVIGALVGIGYIFFPGLVEAGTGFVQGSWMEH
jgi:cyanate permease